MHHTNFDVHTKPSTTNCGKGHDLDMEAHHPDGSFQGVYCPHKHSLHVNKVTGVTTSRKGQRYMSDMSQMLHSGHFTHVNIVTKNPDDAAALKAAGMHHHATITKDMTNVPIRTKYSQDDHAVLDYAGIRAEAKNILATLMERKGQK